jgi:hypothetical protein
MSKEKEEFKEKVKGEKEKIIADEDQMTDISDEEIEPADELISQTMPILYQAILTHNTEEIRSCLNSYEAEMRELYTDEECTTSDVHNIYSTRIGDAIDNGVNSDHQDLMPIQVADRFGYHDICQLLISTFDDDKSKCTGETSQENVSQD